MKTFPYVVENAFGLHVLPANQIASRANAYPDTLITIACGPETVVANSAVKLMSLGIKKGDTIVLSCDGEFEQDAIESIGHLITEIL